MKKHGRRQHLCSTGTECWVPAVSVGPCAEYQGSTRCYLHATMFSFEMDTANSLLTDHLSRKPVLKQKLPQEFKTFLQIKWLWKKNVWTASKGHWNDSQGHSVPHPSPVFFSSSEHLLLAHTLDFVCLHCLIHSPSLNKLLYKHTKKKEC